MLGLLMCSEPRILTYPGEKKRWEVAGHSELERRLLCLPLRGQINPAGYQRLRRQLCWMITLDDRLDDLRREKGEPNQPAHVVFGEALALPDLGHGGNLSRYVEAHTDFHRISGSLRSQVGALEMELRRTAPAELFEFIDRTRELLNLHRHDLTFEQMTAIREIIEKAEALKLDALITDLPKRLTKLEAELPTLSR